MRQSLRLRSNTLAALVGLLMLATVAALVLTTTQMERATGRLLRQVENVQLAGEVWSAMLYHSYALAAFEQTAEPWYGEEVERVTGRIGQLLARARQLSEGEDQRARIDRLTVAAQAYLAHPYPEPGTLEETTGRALESERELATALIESSIARADETLVTTQRWGRTIRLLGLGVLVLLAAILASTLWGVRQQITRPLWKVREAMIRFRPEAPFEPAPEEGVGEIRDIGQSFNEVVSELQRQRALSLQFISGIAHDLRNPIHALRLTAKSTLPPGRPLPPEETLRKRFDLIARQADRLNRLVDDLLDTTRIEAGNLSLQLDVHDLVALAQEAIELHRPLAERHELVAVLPDHPVWVRCDATRVSQVLNNLLNNAIKYSPEGGPVTVEVEEGRDFGWLSVADNGIGIPDAERDSIFEPFRRSTTTRGEIPGIGLGLSVSRRIVEAHGGRIRLESELGRGSTFRISLPLWARVAAGEGAGEHPAPVG